MVLAVQTESPRATAIRYRAETRTVELIVELENHKRSAGKEPPLKWH